MYSKYQTPIISIVITGIIVFLFSGCASGCGVTIKDELFLQNVEVTGSPNQLPVRVTDSEMKKNAFHISPHISLNNKKTYTMPYAGRRYNGTIPDSLSDFRRRGVEWNLSNLRYGLDLDYALSDNIAFMGGIASSSVKGMQFTDAYAGFGFFTSDSSLGFRLNAGVQYASITYSASSIMVRTITDFSGTSRYVIYFVDKGREPHYNMFANITLNSAHRDWLFNYFFQIGINPQSLTDFTPHQTVSFSGIPPFDVTHIVTDFRAETNVTWLSVVPGIYFYVGPSQRILLGLRTMTDISDLPDSYEAGPLLIPMMQLDWGL